MALSEYKFRILFRPPAIIYNLQQAPKFVLFVLFCFLTREGFRSTEESRQQNKKLIGKKLNAAFFGLSS